MYVTSGGIEAAQLATAPTTDSSKPSQNNTGNSQREALAAVEYASDGEGKENQ